MAKQKSGQKMFASEAFKEMYPHYEELGNTALQPIDVDWKIQSTKNGKVTVVPYTDVRYVFDILNRAFGLENYKLKVDKYLVETNTREWTEEEQKDVWANKQKKTITYDVKKTKVEHTYAYRATLHIKCPDGQWVEHDDESEATDIEPVKGGVSGAYKRVLVHVFASVQDLYLYPRVVISTSETLYSLYAYQKGLADIVTRFNAKKVSKSDYIDLKADKESGVKEQQKEEQKVEEPKKDVPAPRLRVSCQKEDKAIEYTGVLNNKYMGDWKARKEFQTMVFDAAGAKKIEHRTLIRAKTNSLGTVLFFQMNEGDNVLYCISDFSDDAKAVEIWGKWNFSIADGAANIAK